MHSLTEGIAEVLRRQNEFEKRLIKLESVVFPDSPKPSESSRVEQAPQIDLSAREPAPSLAPPGVSAVRPQTPRSLSKKPVLETKVGLTILNRVGVVTLVLGIAFFFKWAADNNWIGPTGRVILGIVAGLAVLVGADILWRKKQEIFAQGLTGAGIAVLYLSIYASFGFYHLILQWFAFLLLFVVTCLALALSLRYAAQAITALGLFGGYLTPLLLSSGEDRPWFLFSYLLLLNLVAIGLARKRNWRGLEVIAFVATASIYGGWLLHGKPDNGEKFVGAVALLAYYLLFSQISFQALLFGTQFLAAMALSVICENSPGTFFPLSLLIVGGGLAVADLRRLPSGLSVAFASFWASYAAWSVFSPADLGTAGRFIGITLVFLLFFGWQAWVFITKRYPLTSQRLAVFTLNAIAYYGAAYSLLNKPDRAYLGLLAVAVAVVYVQLAVRLYRRRISNEQDLRPMVLSLGIAACMLTLAIPIQFTGLTITLAWALEAAALAWISLHLRDSKAVITSLVIFLLALIRVILFDSQIYVYDQSHSLLWNRRFLTFVVVGCCLLAAARWSRWYKRVALVDYFAGHFVLLFGLTLEVIDWASRLRIPQSIASVETLSISVLFGIYGVILIALGVATRTALNRITGLVLIGLVIVKLYLFDVWQLERIYRISAFVALGVLLIGTSFLYSRFRRVVESWWKNDENASS